MVAAAARRAERDARRQREAIAFLASQFGVKAATEPVCLGHSAPAEVLRAWSCDRPGTSALHGPRGGGKSYLSALATHLDSLRYERHGTAILGGSLAQSKQIYNALRDFDRRTPDTNVFLSFTKQEALYCTGSEVAILAASPTSVRGPHVPSLCLDEVDEIEPDIRESAYGMSMAFDGVPASVRLTSTWHRIAGPMAELMSRGRAGAFPVWTFCLFEVLERCPTSRSGRNLEGCPECPLMRWCHADIGSTGVPRAKRSDGHYTIESAIQKVQALSLRVFESDYLCLQPRAAGVWFTRWDDAIHLTTRAEYDPALPVWAAIDCGVHTGAVLFQIIQEPGWGHPLCSVFGDFYAYDVGAEAAARQIIGVIEERTGEPYTPNRRVNVSLDSAGGQRNAVGGTVIGEYIKAGLVTENRLRYWPKYPGSIANSLALVESFVESADGRPWLRVHPRCQHLADAFKSYVRRKKDNQYLDEPEEPQHPHEELIDSLRGGLALEFPDGLKPEPKYHDRVPFSQVF